MKAAPFLLAVLLAGCATTASQVPVYTVGQAWENVDTLKGKRIVVLGYLSPCYQLGCSLSDTLARDYRKRKLGLGGFPGFDRLAQAWVGKRVAIEADYTGDCVKGLCTDRATSLENPVILGAAEPYLKNMHP